MKIRVEPLQLLHQFLPLKRIGQLKLLLLELYQIQVEGLALNMLLLRNPEQLTEDSKAQPPIYLPDLIQSNFSTREILMVGDMATFEELYHQMELRILLMVPMSQAPILEVYGQNIPLQ